MPAFTLTLITPHLSVQVTGFVGAERAGWEQLIRHMGAEMCKSLKKRVTTHLVCKEVSEAVRTRSFSKQDVRLL